MKGEMNAFDIMAISGEMQSLVGGFVDKVFNWDKRNVLFRINTQQGKMELYFKGTKWLFVPESKPDAPDTPSSFAVHARKLLGNARVLSVEQREFDRILVLKVANREAAFDIIFELFGDGNLLIVGDGKIVNCIEQKKWRHRDVLIGADYQFPLSRFDPKVEDEGGFKKAIAGSTADVVRTLATSANIGGQYAEEVCLRSGIDKSRKAKTLTDQETNGLFQSIRDVLDSIKASPSPRLIYDGDLVVDVTPIELRMHSSLRPEKKATMSEALDMFVKSVRVEEKKEEKDEELERLIRQMEQMTQNVTRQREESERLAERANSLYINYQQATDLLARLKEIASMGDWEAIKSAMLGIPGVVTVDPKNHNATVKLGEFEVKVDYTAGLEENANLLFLEAKEAKSKLVGAEQAAKETELKIASRRKKGEAMARTAVKEVKPTKRFWFEAYKWFITSGGKLVLAGRDARGNDQVVKKHLTSKDRYAHADVHGAPSTILKEGGTATEEELRELCLFALAHSKAWNAGVSEGTAYWVEPDQVTKTPDAGEFVPRGGFVIRGKRNYAHHLPLELAVGEISYEGARKIMSGPRSSVEKLSTKYAVIVPGKNTGGNASAVLAKIFGVPEEEIARILPPGEAEIKERHNLE
ncbi:MAG TPA: ribosome rescue protein RqcH [Methanomassiliicoccales archaeon]|jgi:predicted ribosome quality control (RQC) complex YloA/Tae2 family protein